MLRALPLLAVLLLGLGAVPAARGQSPDRAVAVTIDDLPAVALDGDTEAYRQITERLLASLTRHGVPAVGFVNEGRLFVDGRLDSARVALLQRWLDAGLELGNHTFAHPSLHRTPVAEYEADVLRGEAVTRPLMAETGRTLRFFRHPYLHTGRDLATRDSVHAFLGRHGYRVAPVTIDNSDWIFARAYDRAIARGDTATQRRIADAYVPYMASKLAFYERQEEALFRRPIKHVLLLHANHLNADHFDRLAEMVRGRGYRFVPLDEALADPAYASADTFTGAAGISWLDRWALAAGKSRAFFEGDPTTPGWVMAEADVDSE